ncbi:hypothetical protein D8674_029998 [Pyrus ussuriensis x Pyrus communis]|uniref:Uncharacterized protein n=1 Tax=Pyrus ussuriensis x Pyrus communis TaxID=2448454 RepID=A0A5N5I5E9_9ROSA|nr:hypothetical protein D8674_029998 [Pyrus ussuriensis x Pyrus communis]
MVANFNNIITDHLFRVLHSDSVSPQFLIPSSYGNPCLDLFFHVLYLKQLLPLAWSHNPLITPLTTLKLICNLRDLSNDLGKADEEAFCAAAFWLHQNHPRTLACNLASFAGEGEFGRSIGLMQDLVEILYRVLEGQDVRRRKKKNNQHNHHHQEKAAAAAARKKAQLKSDIEKLKKGDTCEISSVPYFCPSVDSSMERATLLCESIARKIIPLESSHGGCRVRDRLKKEVLVPLTFALDYSQGFDSSAKPCAVKEYLEEVKAGKIIEYVNNHGVGQAAELQWKAIVKAKVGKLENCLAVCDVSPSSMVGISADVSVAMGLLVSELSEKPSWKGKVINFSPNPDLHLVQGNDLKSKCAFVRRLDCGEHIDLRKVFDLILEAAMKGNLKAEQMIKKVFVFNFDCALSNSNNSSRWESKYEAIRNMFKEKGYENAVPEIVYWKVDTLVAPCTKPGVTIFGGFSKDLLRLFLDNDGKVSPYHVMEAALSPKEYQNLAVMDSVLIS